MSSAVLLDPAVSGPPSGSDPELDRLAQLAADVGGRSDRALAALFDLPEVPLPGRGGTRRRWEMLATLAAVDLTAARVAEAHLDALAILAELREPADLGGLGVDARSSWGVFAAEGGDTPVQAEKTDDGWRLDGVKPWCSLAGLLSHALITARVDSGHRRLFAIRLRDSSVRAGDGEWVSRGLADVPSGAIELTAAPAVPVGENGWYLERPGFAWGGAGVAACWYGGAVALARTLAGRIVPRHGDVLGDMHLGAVDLELTAARAVLAAAATEVDAGADQDGANRLAARVRGVVAGAAEDVIIRTGHALGPAPLAQDEEHARRVADLTIYLRQHHAERDRAALGATVAVAGAW
jgi:alkylation response protein AidB-like acyl-CoA dehydrogenase